MIYILRVYKYIYIYLVYIKVRRVENTSTIIVLHERAIWPGSSAAPSVGAGCNQPYWPDQKHHEKQDCLVTHAKNRGMPAVLSTNPTEEGATVRHRQKHIHRVHCVSWTVINLLVIVSETLVDTSTLLTAKL